MVITLITVLSLQLGLSGGGRIRIHIKPLSEVIDTGDAEGSEAVGGAPPTYLVTH